MATESIVPVDVYYNILHRIKDVTWLWTTCRAVSRDFRAAVDLVFIRRHLPRTSLGIDCGMFWDPKIGKVFLDSNLEFDGLDPNDTSIAIFREKECHDDFKPRLIKSLKGKFDNRYGNACHAPRIVIKMRRMANDTPICDMVADWDNLQLTANWKKMFSEFFAEEKAYSLATERRLEALKPSIATLRDDPQTDMFRAIFEAYDACTADVREEVRTRRIKRHVWDQRGTDLGHSDNAGLKAVKEIRNALGWCQFSDDEGEGEGEGEDDEPNEEDDGDEEEDENDWEDVESDDVEGYDEDEKDYEEEEEEEEDVEEDRRTRQKTGPSVHTVPTGVRKTRRSHHPDQLPPSQGTSPAPASFQFTFQSPT